MAIIEKNMYVCTDVNNNNNKFWEITLHDDGHVYTRNGRVGAAGQINDLGIGGKQLVLSKIREKERKGYKLIPIIGSTGTSQGMTSNDLVKTAAKEQIAQGNPVLSALIDRLVKANKHQLLVASGGQMDLDTVTGIVSTPVGVVTLQNVQNARLCLDKLEFFVLRKDFSNSKYIEVLNDYLMLVPQKVGRQAGWHKEFFTGTTALVKQNELLDQLESSIEIAQQELVNKSKIDCGDTPKVFDVSLDQITDSAIIKKISSYYAKSINTRHECSHLKPVNFFEITIASMQNAWEQDGAKLNNHQQLWHGTRTHNLLSIMKGGLIVPKSGGSIHITGRMFGDGLYFSDQSSKALNYAYGYWDGGRRDNNCFMFLADVAMGKMYTPDRPTGRDKLPRGYDSCYAKAGVSAVKNNEMIVYRPSQVNLKYLIEFSA